MCELVSHHIYKFMNYDESCTPFRILSVTESLPSTQEYSKQDGAKVARHLMASPNCVVSTFPTHQWHLCITLSKCILW